MDIFSTISRKFRNLIKLPGAYLDNFRHRSRVKGKPVAEVFTYIHDSNYWGDSESVSGAGSNEDQTRTIVQAIPAVLKKYQVKRMLDLPCGDFNWMRRVDLQGITYTGGDIVEQIVKKNQERYGSDTISFRRLNLITDSLPDADLVLCRDCFIHLSNAQVLESIANLKKQNIRYLLTTSHNQREKNKDIAAGEWRPINLEIAPFNLTALEVIHENCTEDQGRRADKCLILVDLKA